MSQGVSDADSYQWEIAQVLSDAARLGLIENPIVIRPGKSSLDMIPVSHARELCELLCAFPVAARAWLACENLQPELDAVITHLRRMKRTEVAPEHALVKLRGRVKAG